MSSICLLNVNVYRVAAMRIVYAADSDAVAADGVFFPTGAVAPVFARATYQNRLPPTCIIISFCIQGGLAYLASRRNSRDSMKSAASNASIFSNEDIGPLAFQASARGRQRRTSNFLELPGKFNHIHCKCK